MLAAGPLRRALPTAFSTSRPPTSVVLNHAPLWSAPLRTRLQPRIPVAARARSSFGGDGGPSPRVGWGRPRPQYSRFQKTGNDFRTAWAQNPGTRRLVYFGVGAFGVYYVSNLERVPVTNRLRFNATSPEREVALSQMMYKQVMREYRDRLVPAWHPYSKMVQKVLNNLIPASGLTDANWEVHVINDPKQKNAMVIPGGKVFVFSGILPICAGEDGLAAVLGHEIAHNVAHHAAERMSQLNLVIIAVTAVAWLFGIPETLTSPLLQFTFVMPGSRTQEAEADYIGLMMMAQSCYDPRAAVGLWERMKKAEEFSPPQWMSTHPSTHKRLEKIQEWLPEAEAKQLSSDCSSTLSYANEFKRAYDEVVW